MSKNKKKKFIKDLYSLLNEYQDISGSFVRSVLIGEGVYLSMQIEEDRGSGVRVALDEVVSAASALGVELRIHDNVLH